METRYAIHPEHAKQFGTKDLRESFHIDGLFESGQTKLVYSYDDRLIVGGIQPERPLGLDADESVIGSKYLLQRREMGVINIGSDGKITVDGAAYDLGTRDALYIGMGAKELIFSSKNSEVPAKYYLLCAPAHKIYPTTKISVGESEPSHLGSHEQSNKRTIYKYIHPDGVQSCQLVMGMTLLEPKNVWNTMPTHTHPRRIEAYFYFDLPADDIVMHFMGEPGETRHIVVRCDEAVLSPSWSIHSGVGTHNYSFIWGMAGENQVFSDMDNVSMADLR